MSHVIDLYVHLLDHSGPNQPIFLSDLRIFSMSYSRFRHIIMERTVAGRLLRLEKGVCCLPDPSGRPAPAYTAEDLIREKYVYSGKSRYGFFAGTAFAHEIGLTSQAPRCTRCTPTKS